MNIKKSKYDFLLLSILLVVGFLSPYSYASDFGACDVQCKSLFKQLKRFANNGSPHAQTVLALSYKTGEMGVKDSGLAWKWMKRAKYQRYAPALFFISEWYRQGYDSEIRLSKASKYLEQSAKRKYPPALLSLANINYMKQNYEDALKLAKEYYQFNEFEAGKLIKKILNKTGGSMNELSLFALDSKIKSSKFVDEFGGETITIVGADTTPEVLLTYFIQDIKRQGLYDHRGMTGTKIGDRKCGQRGSACEFVNGENLFLYLYN